VEQQWRSLKYNEVYLKGCDMVAETWPGIGKYNRFYNHAPG